MTNRNTASLPRRARFSAGDEAFAAWRDDLRSGRGPVLLRHAAPYPEIGPGLVTLIGGAPAGGKTAFATMMGVEILRFHPDVRVLLANCEMSPEALLNRQLARLSGIDAELIRHRHLGPEHEERLAAGLATLESVVGRLAFMHAPYDIGNVAATADAFGADVVIIDYVQRFTVPTEDAEARHRVNRTMDYLRQFANAGAAVLVVSAVGRTKDRAGRSSYTGAGLNLASFRESSELEFGADDAMILAPVDDADPTIVRLSHLKARHGRQVNQDFHFDRSVQSFRLISSPAFTAGGVESSSTTHGSIRTTRRTSITEELRMLWDSNAAAGEGELPPDSPETGVDER